jgi:ABC-type lipoprotein release transport system permease subunit
VILGLGFSGTLIDNISQNIPGLEYRVPWGVLLLVVLVGYSASPLTTFVPARRASSVYPAEALRYE